MEQRIKTEGVSLGGAQREKTQAECEEMCDNTENCKSFSYSPGEQNCYLFDRELTGNEPQKEWYDFYTVYKNCGEYGNYEKHRNTYPKNIISIKLLLKEKDKINLFILAQPQSGSVQCKTTEDPNRFAPANTSCSFPFLHDGSMYNDCSWDEKGAWCSTETDNQYNHQLGKEGACSSSCPIKPHSSNLSKFRIVCSSIYESVLIILSHFFLVK
jgi:hypothetical protein